MLRTHTCGELRKEQRDQDVMLCGWVHRRRDHGKLIFIDIRDRYGITQVVFVPSVNQPAHDLAQKLGSEFVIRVGGKVNVYDIRQRPAKFLFAFGEPGSGEGQFSYPNGIAVDTRLGLLYVADWGNNRVSVWAY